MKKFLYLIIAAPVLVLFTASCSSDDDVSHTILEAETHYDVPYGQHPRQVYDLYLPEGRTQNSTKVIVLVHGGGWTSGDKSDMNTVVDYLRAQHPDYAIANINYVLAEIGVPAFPNQFLDLGKVISQLTNQQHQLQIQPQFGLMGVSAGAHISMMYDYVYDTSNQVKFVANIVGPTDFTDPFYTDYPDFEVLFELLVDTDAYPQGTDIIEALSPVYQVTAASSPTIVFYGDQDPIVPLSNGYALEAVLNAHGVTNALHIYNGGHGDDWSAADILDMQLNLENFMLTHLPL